MYDGLKEAKVQLITHNISGLLKTWSSYIDSSESVELISYVLELMAYYQQFNLYSCLFLSAMIIILGLNIYNLNCLQHEILYLYEQISPSQNSKFIEKYRMFIH